MKLSDSVVSASNGGQYTIIGHNMMSDEKLTTTKPS